MGLFNILDKIFGFEYKGRKYYEDKMKEIDEEYKRSTIPKKWEPGLPYNSDTKHLWDEHKEEISPELRKIFEKMAPKTTGVLVDSNLWSYR